MSDRKFDDTPIEARYARALRSMTEVGKGGKNPHFKSEYVQLPDLLAHLRPALDAVGLAVAQWIKDEPLDGSRATCVETWLIDDNGNTLCIGSMPLPQIDNPQHVGGAVTYFRRYSLMAAFGLAGDDDDGNSAREGVEIDRLAKAFGSFCNNHGIDKAFAANWLRDLTGITPRAMGLADWKAAATKTSQLLDAWNAKEQQS